MAGISDEIVWDLLNKQFCSFKLKLPTKTSNFCKNQYNTTGLCNKQSCPLANSRYATIRADEGTGRLYLYIKSVERSHMPSKWWEKIRLSSNYTKALEQIDERLKYWPKFLQHRNKQRLTRLTQVRVRMQRLAKEEERLGETTVSRLAPKIRRREQTRERKAESAAKIERAIERELVERLRSGAYGDKPLNVDENVWNKVMRGLERGGELEADEDLDEGEMMSENELEEEYEYEDGVGDVEYVSGSDIDESDEEGVEDLEDWLGSGEEEEGSEEEDDEDDDNEDDDEDDSDDETAALKKQLSDLKRKRPAAPSKPRKKGAKDGKSASRKIEYEVEREPAQREMLLAK